MSLSFGSSRGLLESLRRGDGASAGSVPAPS